MTTSLNSLTQTMTDLLSSTRNDISTHPVWTLPVHENSQAGVSAKTDEFFTYLSHLQLYGEQTYLTEKTPTAPSGRTVPERFAALLLDLSAVGESAGWIQGVSFQEMATALNTHRETIAALLRSFQRQELIVIHVDGIQIVDPESLAEIGGEPLL